MTMYPDTTFFNTVEDTTAKLRSYLLGFSLHFSALIPADLADLPDRMKAEHLADRILFIVTSLNPLLATRVPDLHDWLCDIIAFLFDKVNEGDQTLASLLKLSELDQATRATLFEDWDDGRSILSHAQASPVDKHTLEQALCVLVGSTRYAYPGVALLSRILQELEDHPTL